MAKFFLKFAPLLVILFCLASPAQAAVTPLGISLFPPLEFPFEDVTVAGLRLNLLWGNHRTVYGFDVGGLGNVTSLNFGGLLQAAGGFNYNKGETHVVGLQFAGVTNINVNKAHIYGAQVSLFNTSEAEGRLVGVGLGLLANNVRHTDVVGVQLGIYNSARDVYGVQVGLINMADHLHGLQVGLLNFNRQGLFAVCPIINFGF